MRTFFTENLGLLVVALLFGGLLSNLTVHGSSAKQVSSEIDPADAQRAFRSIRGHWYDSSEHDFAPPTLRKAEDHPVRIDGRLARPRRPWNWPNFNWGLGGFSRVLFYGILIASTAALLICLIFLVRHFAPGVSGSSQKRSKKSIEIDLTKVEDLPFAVHRMEGDLLGHARHLADAGKFEQATIYLYGYVLLALDQSRKVFLQKGKTNRMYLHELDRFPPLESIAETIMLKFEQVHFGHRSISPESFEQSWNELDEFHRLLRTEPSKESDYVPGTKVAEATS